MLKGADVDSVWEGPAGISECGGGCGRGREDPEDKRNHLIVFLSAQSYQNTEISLLQKPSNVYQNRICSVFLFLEYPPPSPNVDTISSCHFEIGAFGLSIPFSTLSAPQPQHEPLGNNQDS